MECCGEGGTRELVEGEAEGARWPPPSPAVIDTSSYVSCSSSLQQSATFKRYDSPASANSDQVTTKVPIYNIALVGLELSCLMETLPTYLEWLLHVYMRGTSMQLSISDTGTCDIGL
jgi:hypothetical protein